MTRFVYRLASLLNVKKQMEAQKKIEYGKALQHLEEQKRIKAMLEGQLGDQVTQFKSSLYERIEPMDIRRYNNMIEWLKQKIAHQQKRVDEAAKAAEVARLALVEAMKEHKMLDTDKGNQLEAYLYDQRLAEQKRMDEITCYRYNIAVR